MVDIISRSQWGAHAPEGGLTRVDPGSRQYKFLHYSLGEELGRADTAAWVREIQAFHQGPQRNWTDIGYNLLVDNTGQIFEGRGLDVVGAHCPNFNTSGYGLCFLGDDDPDVTDVSDAAKRAIREVWSFLDERSGKPLLSRGHRDGKSTQCPGDELYSWLHSGMPLGAVVPMSRPAPSPPVQRPPAVQHGAAPGYPLGRCRAHGRLMVFGPRTGPDHHVSGYYQRLSSGRRGHQGLHAWQYRMKQRGWVIRADGQYGPNTAHVARAFQVEKGLGVDSLIGPQTWRAAWEAPVS